MELISGFKILIFFLMSSFQNNQFQALKFWNLRLKNLDQNDDRAMDVSNFKMVPEGNPLAIQNKKKNVNP